MREHALREHALRECLEGKCHGGKMGKSEGPEDAKGG